MDVLKTGKFIEHYGRAIVWVLGLVMGAFAAATFYFYAYSPGGDEILQSAGASLKEDILNTVIADFNQRQEKLAELKRQPLEIRDVFR